MSYSILHTSIANEPYIPGSIIVENLTRVALQVREMVRNGTITYAKNDTGVYIYLNGSFLMWVEKVGENESWSLLLGPLYNKTLNNNAVMYMRTVEANMSNKITMYNLVCLIYNVSDTHRIYIAIVGKKLNETHYSYVFSLAMYWFKNKAVFY